MKAAVLFLVAIVMVACAAQSTKDRDDFKKSKAGLKNKSNRQIGNQVRGDLKSNSKIKKIGNSRLDDIVGDTKKIIDSSDYKSKKDIVSQLRKDLNIDSSEIDDDTLGQIVDDEEKIGRRFKKDEDAAKMSAEEEQKKIDEYYAKQG